MKNLMLHTFLRKYTQYIFANIKKYSFLTFIVISCLGISVYSVFAERALSNIVDFWGINITPLGQTASGKIGDLITVRYRIDGSAIRSSNDSQTSWGFYVSIPEEAENVHFYLEGIPKAMTWMVDGIEKWQVGDHGQFWYLQDLHIPLIEWTDVGNYDITSDVYQKILQKESFTAVVIDTSNTAPKWYRDYRISRFWNLYSMSVEFTIKPQKTETYWPIRARSVWHCLVETCDTLDMYRKHNEFIQPSEVHIWDFDNNGIYTNEDSCSVTRNTKNWYETKHDVLASATAPGKFNYARDFNLKLNPAVTYTAPLIEDLCDQAVVPVTVTP